MKEKVSAEALMREIRRKTRKKYSAEEKVRIVLEGLRGEASLGIDKKPQEGVPITLGIPPERLGDLRVTFSAADRALHQIGQPGGARDSVEGGRRGAQHKLQIRCNNQAIIGEDQPTERNRILEA